MRGHRRLWLVTAGVVVVIAIAITVWLTHGNHPRANASASSTPKVTASVMPATDVTSLQQKLASNGRTVQATALVTDERKPYLQQSQPMLPPGTKVTIAPKTFKVSGDVATVEATASGETFTLYLQRENGAWLIVTTEEK